MNMHADAHHMNLSIRSFICTYEGVYLFKCLNLNTYACTQVKALGTLAMIDEGELDWKVGLQACVYALPRAWVSARTRACAYVHTVCTST